MFSSSDVIELLERGKNKGWLSLDEITEVLVELYDLDKEVIGEFYDYCSERNILILR